MTLCNTPCLRRFTPHSATPTYPLNCVEIVPAVDARAVRSHFRSMQNIWGRSSESALSGEELREEVRLHLARHLGDPHIAFSDNDGWAGNSREPGPPVDVLVVPPEGERRFAYVCSFGSSLKKRPGGGGRMEFALAVPQNGDPQSDLAILNLGANIVRQFAKLVHIQSIRVLAGETVQFSRNPRPILEGSKQVAFTFMEPRLPSDGFKRMAPPNGEAVLFWSPVPIDRDELDASGRHGVIQFTRGLIRAGVTEMLHAQRPSAARAAYGLRRPFVKLVRDCVRRVRGRGKSL